MILKSTGGYGLTDFIKGEAKKLKKGLQDRVKSHMDDMVGSLPEDSSGWKKTGKYISSLGKKMTGASTKALDNTKETYIPAKKDELSVDGLETKIGSALKIYVGKKQAKECRDLCMKLQTYRMEDSIKNMILDDVAGRAYTTMEEVDAFYKSEKLRTYPTKAKNAINAISAHEGAMKREKRHRLLLQEIQNSGMDAAIKDTIVAHAKQKGFTSMVDLKRFYIGDAEEELELDSDLVDDIIREITRYETARMIR